MAAVGIRDVDAIDPLEVGMGTGIVFELWETQRNRWKKLPHISMS